MSWEGSKEADLSPGVVFGKVWNVLPQPGSAADPVPSTAQECQISWDVMEVLLPGTGDRLSVMSESQTWLGAGLEQILSYSHNTGWESLWDPHSNHEETHGITWTK